MKLLNTAELVHRTEAELAALAGELNRALASATPYSAEWRALYANLETVLRVLRMRRLDCRPR